MAAQVKQRNTDLERYQRFMDRQAQVRFGKDYRAAIKHGETTGAIGGSGDLQSLRVGRWINAHSWPEKVTASLALYSGAFELQEQHLYYSKSMLHPLAYHPLYSHLPWPLTDGTFSIAEQLGLTRWHPRTWDDDRNAWFIGCWVGDFLVYRLDHNKHPCVLFWESKDKPESHGVPGGGTAKRYSPKEIERVKIRNTICAAYAEQLGSRVVEFSASDLPYQLQKSLVSLCRNQNADVNLPDSMIAELVHAYREAIGQDIPAVDVARRLVQNGQQLAIAKDLLDVAVWERHVRVDLYQPLLWNRPLLPEQSDVLEDYAHYFRP